ncbi:A/G-specific adenine glycosylase [Bacillus aquiflavi]|uniref:Adenine DNA glycosylase n=1 Tax=Bacillus aquiflavi TaxID=2672567 RepID=A0A6B3VUQ2_9BACI|nr:A/G-specific adenine glycosylase [Bacillus aquiflavi]MBA4536324.1 A/G-specific adenine glycosylase [Bacillus aquiflavi]NEY80692.1 A/G-specific adenine glycosylase [Bacillus aquiflavi]UAC48841.1 A/G-specific adenine glycosylase [Bacillus aquiflavi]
MTSLKNLHDFDKISFQKDLIDWFQKEQRDLPWRKDKDPYKIWVSEIMLQQTRVDTVIPYFNNFIEKFPTVDALAEANEEEVLKAWEGLGYYSRARNLQEAVREVKEKYNSQVPKKKEEIASLKGVGPYTTGAVLSIAFNLPEPAVDGNVMRVLSRILSIWDDIAKSSSRKIFETAVRELISHENPSFFNQALMELGALVCTPTSPSCLLCPVREHCHGFQEGVEDHLPVKTKKKKPRSIQLAAAVLTDQAGRLLIHKRPNKGLLADLWEFPNVELHLSFSDEKARLKDFLKETYHVTANPEHFLCSIEHVFTHLIWNIRVYKGELQTSVTESDKLKLVTIEEITKLAFPVSHQKILKAFLKNSKL